MALPLGGEQALSPSARAARRKGLAKGRGGVQALAMAAGPEVGIPVEAATAALESAEKLLTTPIVTLAGQHFRVHEVRIGRRKERILTPVDWKVNVNLLNLGLGTIAVGVAALGALFVWHGIGTGGLVTRAPIQILPGLKDMGRGELMVICRNLHRQYQASLAAGDKGNAGHAWDAAKANGCTWTRYTPRPKG